MKTSQPNYDQSVFHEWRAADRQAHALESALTQTSLAALDGKGQLPSDEQRAKAQGLRRVANHLFALAMAEMTRKGKRPE